VNLLDIFQGYARKGGGATGGKKTVFPSFFPYAFNIKGGQN